VLLGLIAVAIVVLVIRRRRREKTVLSGQRDPSFDNGGWSVDGGSSEDVGRP
jgi:hypothetical protein